MLVHICSCVGPMTANKILSLVFICLWGWHEVTAQRRQQGFQRIANNEASQASLAEWRNIPGLELLCIARVLNQQGQTLEATLLNGISPSNPSLAGVRAQCKSKSHTNPTNDTIIPK